MEKLPHTANSVKKLAKKKSAKKEPANQELPGMNTDMLSVPDVVYAAHRERLTAFKEPLHAAEFGYFAENFLHLGSYADKQLNPMQASTDLVNRPGYYGSKDDCRIHRLQKAMVLGLALEGALRHRETAFAQEPPVIKLSMLMELVEEYIHALGLYVPKGCGSKLSRQRLKRAQGQLRTAALATIIDGMNLNTAADNDLPF